jgi:hypothetical protein
MMKGYQSFEDFHFIAESFLLDLTGVLLGEDLHRSHLSASLVDCLPHLTVCSLTERRTHQVVLASDLSTLLRHSIE